MGFSRQEYWSELPFPSPGDLPDLGIEPKSPALQEDALTSEPPGKPSPGERSLPGQYLLPPRPVKALYLTLSKDPSSNLSFHAQWGGR